MIFNRIFAMPNAETFSIKPIGEFVQKYGQASKISVDPFARNKRWATYTNDLNPETAAEYHMDAKDFCAMLVAKEIVCDFGLFDPPYSPRQISEVYKGVGRSVTMQDTQSSFWKIIKDALHPLISKNGIVLSFGWNSQGMGKTRGYEIIEILLVAHGGAHNDTICIAERKI
jgi:hypothetical protein